MWFSLCLFCLQLSKCLEPINWCFLLIQIIFQPMFLQIFSAFDSPFSFYGTLVTHILEHLIFYMLLSLYLPFKLSFFLFLRLFIISSDVFSSSLALYLHSKLLWRLVSEFSSQVYFSVPEFPFLSFYSFISLLSFPPSIHSSWQSFPLSPWAYLEWLF